MGGIRADLENLATELHRYLYGNKYDIAHLPIGSPAFQHEFFGRTESMRRNYPMSDYATQFIFSHTVRESVEEPQSDGSIVKKSVFRFEQFI